MQILVVSPSITFQHYVLTYFNCIAMVFSQSISLSRLGTLEVMYAYPFTPYEGVLSEGMKAAYDKK